MMQSFAATHFLRQTLRPPIVFPQNYNKLLQTISPG
jgi:hypothetical protein